MQGLDLADQIEWSREIPAQVAKVYSPPLCKQHNRISHNFCTNVDQTKCYIDRIEQSPGANVFNSNFEELAFDTLVSVNREPFIKAQPEIEHWVDTGQPPCMVYKSTGNPKFNNNFKDDLVCPQKSHRKSEGKVKRKPKSTPILTCTCPDDNCQLEERHLITSFHNNCMCEKPSNACRKVCNRNKKCVKKCVRVSSSSESNDYHELKKLIPKVLRKSMEFYDGYSRKTIKSPVNNSDEHCGTCKVISVDRKQIKCKPLRKKEVCKIVQNKIPQNSQPRDQYKILRKYHKKQKQPRISSQQNTSSCDTIVLEVKKIKSKARENSFSKKRQLNVVEEDQPSSKNTHPRVQKHHYKEFIQTKKSVYRNQSSSSDKVSSQSKSSSIDAEVKSKSKSNIMNNNFYKVSTYLYDSDSSVLTANYIQSVRSKMNIKKKSPKVLRNRMVYGSQPSNSASDPSCRKRLELDSIFKSNLPNLLKTELFEDDINCILKSDHNITGNRQQQVLMCHLPNEDFARKSESIFKHSKRKDEDLDKLKHVGKISKEPEVVNDILNSNCNVVVMQSQGDNCYNPKYEENEVVLNTHVQNKKATLTFKQMTNANSIALQTPNRQYQRMNSIEDCSSALDEVSFASSYHDRLVHFTNDAIRYVQNCGLIRKGDYYSTESDSSPNIVIQIKPFKKGHSSRRPDFIARSLNRDKFNMKTF